MNKENPYDVEFTDPNRNLEITLMELRDRIEKIRLDLTQINDSEVRGFAEKVYIDLRIQYFKLIRDDLTLQKMYEEENEEVE
jgi:hypothetical protein